MQPIKDVQFGRTHARPGAAMRQYALSSELL